MSESGCGKPGKNRIRLVISNIWDETASPEKYRNLAHDPENSLVFISHSDCMEQAVNLDMQLRAKWDVKDTIITDIGPAFGAHCGPGAVAVFFIGRETASPDETAEDTTDTESNTRE